jgi:hypothetical protein
MSVIVQIGPWQVDADPAATARTHASMAAGCPERCGCHYCMNFVATRGRAYPAEALRLFEALGIRQDRESEICAPVPLTGGQYLYSGWFHFVGRILDEPTLEPRASVPRSQATESGVVSELRFHALTDHFGILLRAERHLLPEEFGAESVVQLEFTTELPWVLPEPPES